MVNNKIISNYLDMQKLLKALFFILSTWKHFLGPWSWNTHFCFTYYSWIQKNFFTLYSLKCLNGKIYCKYSINKFSNSEHKIEGDDSLSLISLGFHILDYIVWMLLGKTTQIYSRFVRYLEYEREFIVVWYP